MPATPSRRHYIAIFCVSMALLQLEITFARIMSVALLSHYAFVAVSLSMCGLGLSGLVVYLLPNHFRRERLEQQLIAYAWRCAVAAIAALLIFLHIHVVQELSLTGLLSLSAAYLTLAVPFFCGGVCLSLLMTHFSARIGRIYAADLAGASLGCLAAVACLSFVPAPYVVVLVAGLLAATAFGLGWTSLPRRYGGATFALITALALLAVAPATSLLRMKYVKTWTKYYSDHEGWNAFSRVATFQSQLNAAQLVPLKEEYTRYAGLFFPPARILDIDGAAWTPMVKFDGDYEIYSFLRNTVMYLVHHLRTDANVLIIGTGGGRDVLAAKVFGQPRVRGIEINPLMRDIVQEKFGDFSGRPHTLPGMAVTIDEALLQRFVLFLGYPVYALAVVLFALLLFSGIGSLSTARVTAPVRRLSLVLLAIVGMGTLYAYLTPLIITPLLGSSIMLRIAMTVAMLAPIGLLLGMAYPLGIAVLRQVSEELVPWAWGLNGALSVVASVLAVFIGSRVGFTVAFFTGLGAYALALITMRVAIAQAVTTGVRRAGN